MNFTIIFGVDVLDVLNQTIEFLKSKNSNIKDGLNNMFIITPVEHDFIEVMLYIHNCTLPPYDMDNSGNWVKPGSWNSFEISRVYYNRLDVVAIHP